MPLFVIVLGLLASPLVAAAQELEPGAYWPIPRGLNIVTAVNNLSWGDVAFDSSLPIEDAVATIDTVALSFVHAFALAGRSANAGVVVPIAGGHLEGFNDGEFDEVNRFGLGDPRIRLAVNLYGAPTMTPKEFASYRQRAIVGIAISVVPPLGQYDPDRFINLGTNRWSFKPEIGLARTYGRWVVEMMAGAWLFTNNTNFAGGRTREQDPIYATQFHVTYKFTPAMWLAADATYYAGGRTTIGGRPNIDLQRNSRVGATFSRGLGGGKAIRMSVSQGAYTTIGADFTSIAVGYAYAWAR